MDKWTNFVGNMSTIRRSFLRSRRYVSVAFVEYAPPPLFSLVLEMIASEIVGMGCVVLLLWAYVVRLA